jgi:hypothetical protein
VQPVRHGRTGPDEVVQLKASSSFDADRRQHDEAQPPAAAARAARRLARRGRGLRRLAGVVTGVVPGVFGAARAREFRGQHTYFNSGFFPWHGPGTLRT